MTVLGNISVLLAFIVVLLGLVEGNWNWVWYGLGFIAVRSLLAIADNTKPKKGDAK